MEKKENSCRCGYTRTQVFVNYKETSQNHYTDVKVLLFVIKNAFLPKNITNGIDYTSCFKKKKIELNKQHSVQNFELKQLVVYN